FNKQIYKMTTSDIAKYSYLHLFEEKYHSIIALELKEGLTIRRTTEIALQNIEILKKNKVCCMKFDEIQAIRIFHEWDDDGGELFGVKELFFYLRQYY
ncbi:5278_t:CDS:1, partial [Racocetra persica]